MKFDIPKFLAKDTYGNTHNLPQWVRIAITAGVAVIIVIFIFYTYKNIRDRILEQRRIEEVNKLNAKQSAELDALRDQAISIGNVPKDSLPVQKKKLDQAHATLKGPNLTIGEQRAEIDALRAAAMKNQGQTQ